jgi:hypothetical protein
MTVMIQSYFCPSCEATKAPAPAKDPYYKPTNYNVTGPTFPRNPIWTRKMAVASCRTIESALSKMGWHVGLTGGTLYKDGARKDVDFIVYPHVVSLNRHYTEQLVMNGPVLTIARILGFDIQHINRAGHYRDGKVLFKIDDNIDVFVFGTNL